MLLLLNFVLNNSFQFNLVNIIDAFMLDVNKTFPLGKFLKIFTYGFFELTNLIIHLTHFYATGKFGFDALTGGYNLQIAYSTD